MKPHEVNYWVMAGCQSTILEDDLIGKDDVPLDIWNGVEYLFEVSKEQIKNKTRLRKIVLARHVTRYVYKQKTNLTLSRIAEITSSQSEPADHSTVIHSINYVIKRIKADPNFASKINKLVNT